MAAVDGFTLTVPTLPAHQFAVRFGSFSADTDTPVLAANSPVAGTTLTLNQTVAVDVTDATSSISRVLVFASFSDGSTEAVYTGSGFTTQYATGASTASITGGTRFTFTRSGGWKQNPTITAYARDAYGNEQLLTNSIAFVYTPDTTGPTKALVSPSNASTIISTTSIVLDVTDDSGLGTVLLSAQFTDSSEELIYSGSFASGYSTSSTGSVSGGTRYTLMRDSGWRSNPTIRAYATDALGNASSWSTVGTFTFTAAPLTDSTSPVATVVSPTAGTTITSTTPLVVDVTDNLGSTYLRRVLVTAYFAGSAAEELVHDGSSFTLPYATSGLSSISGGYRYSIIRTNGWPGSPTVRCFAFDTAGNES
jgi:hypothetical protein